jgi:hypothetical protein
MLKVRDFCGSRWEGEDGAWRAETFQRVVRGYEESGFEAAGAWGRDYLRVGGEVCYGPELREEQWTM